MNKNEEALKKIEKELINTSYDGTLDQDIRIALNTIKELVKRATPMKPLNYGFGYSDVCPTCNAFVTDDETDTKYNFCRVCGQALGDCETK